MLEKMYLKDENMGTTRRGDRKRCPNLYKLTEIYDKDSEQLNYLFK